MEIFNDLENVNYKVSNFGRVMNSKTNKIVKSRINPRTGYHMVDICKNGVSRTCYLHRLVAKAFLQNLNNKECVDHIDGDKNNNNLSNLRYASYSENQCNRKLNINSVCKGVRFNERSNKWIAYIRYNNERHYLGSFVHFEDAKTARQEKANELFGEFVNQIERI
jgi:hypothetical protein